MSIPADDTQGLDVLVKAAFEGERDWVHDQLDGTSMVEDELMDIDEAETNLKQAILGWVDKVVIGEDKIPPTVAALSPEFLDAYYRGRKHQRTEQRNILREHGYKEGK